jgi:hypothetical protein
MVDCTAGRVPSSKWRTVSVSLLLGGGALLAVCEAVDADAP